MKKKTIVCLSALTAVAVSSSAFAGASYDFHIDFSKGHGTANQSAPNSFGDHDGGSHYDDHSYIKNSYAHSYDFDDNGVKLNVEAGVVGPKDNDGTGSSSNTYQGGGNGVYVGQFYGGLGVGWEINPGDLDDDYHTVDDKNGRDFLVLNFHEKVSLTKIDFDYFGPTSSSKQQSYADFQVYIKGIDGELVYTGNIPYHWGTIEFDSPLEASDTYVIAPKADSKGRKDYFKLRAVGGHTHPSVVPTPTAALAGAVLMGGIVCRRRRRGK
ncbi:MAG: hypothetical protein KTR15_15290 [Phycisphaeraceae bacterium]|nr:hypothetical protein [Phycisphaeraceae bacterium]